MPRFSSLDELLLPLWVAGSFPGCRVPGPAPGAGCACWGDPGVPSADALLLRASCVTGCTAGVLPWARRDACGGTARPSPVLRRHERRYACPLAPVCVLLGSPSRTGGRDIRPRTVLQFWGLVATRPWGGRQVLPPFGARGPPRCVSARQTRLPHLCFSGCDPGL